ncbi:MAG TPA: hypothetical protein VFB06_02350 [Streptosporangiaceae bacterium]|nr:hypothetical protein [Streptosporangiaceae bacterium]
MAEDMAAEIARAAARRLAPEYGKHIEAEVESALSGAQRYDLYEIGILIVAIATLAWEVYAKRRERKEAREVLERAIRTEVRREFGATPQSIRITEIVTTEIVERSE